MVWLPSWIYLLTLLGYPSFRISQLSCQPTRILLGFPAQLRPHSAKKGGHMVWLPSCISSQLCRADLAFRITQPSCQPTTRVLLGCPAQLRHHSVRVAEHKPTRILLGFNLAYSTGLVPRLVELRTPGFSLRSFLVACAHGRQE